MRLRDRRTLDDEPTRNSVHLATTFRVAKETQLRGEFEQGKYRRFSFAQSFADQSAKWNRTATYNGVTAPSAPQNYGALVRSGAVVGRDFTCTANGVIGGVVTAQLQLQDGANHVGG